MVPPGRIQPLAESGQPSRSTIQDRPCPRRHGWPRTCLPDAAKMLRCAGEVEGDRRTGRVRPDVGEVHGIVLRGGGGNEHAVEDVERRPPPPGCHPTAGPAAAMSSDQGGPWSSDRFDPGDAFSDPVEYTSTAGLSSRPRRIRSAMPTRRTSSHMNSRLAGSASTVRPSLRRQQRLSVRSGDREGTAANARRPGSAYSVWPFSPTVVPPRRHEMGRGSSSRLSALATLFLPGSSTPGVLAAFMGTTNEVDHRR